MQRIWVIPGLLLCAFAAFGEAADLHAPCVRSSYSGHSFADSPASPRPDPAFLGVFPHDSRSAAFSGIHCNCDSTSAFSQCAAGCETCRLCSPCDETGRRYALDLGAVFLFRDRPDADRLFVNPVTPEENIDASQFDFAATTGIEAGVIFYEQHDLTDIEVRATWMNDWVDGVTQTFSGNTVQFEMNPVVGTSGPRLGLVSLQSEFFTSEFNLRFRSPQKCDGTTWVLGYRMMHVDELLSGDFVDTAGVLPDELIRVDASNRLHGLQLGGDRVWKNESGWCVRVFGRLGLYGNYADQNTQLISLAAPPVTFPAQDSDGRIACHAELGFSGRYRLSPWLHLTASWRVMYVDGLALAPKQLASTNVVARRGINSDGSLLLNGGTVGVELIY